VINKKNIVLTNRRNRTVRSSKLPYFVEKC
jgi:hypothetical protein